MDLTSLADIASIHNDKIECRSCGPAPQHYFRSANIVAQECRPAQVIWIACQLALVERQRFEHAREIRGAHFKHEVRFIHVAPVFGLEQEATPCTACKRIAYHVGGSLMVMMG